MKKYRVLRTCSGFRGRRWYEDEIVELEDDAKPPYHFELVKGKAAEKSKPEPEKPKSFSEMTAQTKKAPEAGFAKDYDGAKHQKEKTAGEVMKDNKK